MHTDTLLDETPDVFTVYKNLLLVYPTEVILVLEKNSVYVSANLRNTDTTFVVVISRSFRSSPARRSVTQAFHQVRTDGRLDGTCHTL